VIVTTIARERVRLATDRVDDRALSPARHVQLPAAARGRRRGGQVLAEPGGGSRGYGVHRPGLLEQVPRALDDREPVPAAQHRGRVPVEVEDLAVAASDEQERRRAHERKAIGGEVLPAARETTA
jgi:hypothetical protein